MTNDSEFSVNTMVSLQKVENFIKHVFEEGIFGYMPDEYSITVNFKKGADSASRKDWECGIVFPEEFLSN